MGAGLKWIQRMRGISLEESSELLPSLFMSLPYPDNLTGIVSMEGLHRGSQCSPAKTKNKTMCLIFFFFSKYTFTLHNAAEKMFMGCWKLLLLLFLLKQWRDRESHAQTGNGAKMWWRNRSTSLRRMWMPKFTDARKMSGWLKLMK